MNKTAQQLPELIILRNAIVAFHQNMKIAYDKLKTTAMRGTIQTALLAAYKPYLENIAAAPVFGPEFTTIQLKQHLRYLEGILKKFASINAMSQEIFVAKYGQQPYYQNLLLLGKKIKELFIPIAGGVKSTYPDDQLIKNAKMMSNLLDKVGANLVTRLTTYLNGLTPNNNLGKVLAEHISIEKLAQQIEAYYRLTYHW